MKTPKNIEVDSNGTRFTLSLTEGVDISIPVRFDGVAPRAFGAEPATCHPYLAGAQPLSVAQGAGCNCPVFEFSAHLHGTHTECVGHISQGQHVVLEVANLERLRSALLISIVPEPAAQSDESYQPPLRQNDWIVTRKALQAAVGEKRPESLVIRTLPNGEEKRQRDYGREPAPFFSNEAMIFIVELGIDALVIDLPSVDRADDEGILSNHHLYWDVEQGTNEVKQPSGKTITELAWVPDSLPDGLYALALNVANISSDAAPSRPTLYRLAKL